MPDEGYLSENLAELAVGNIRREARSKRCYYHEFRRGGMSYHVVTFEPREEYVPTDSIAHQYREAGEA